MAVNPIDLRGGDASDRPADDYIPVTPGPDPLPNGPCRGLLVAAAGTVNLTTIDGQDRDGVPLQAGYNPLVALKVRAGGTATNIFALY